MVFTHKKIFILCDHTCLVTSESNSVIETCWTFLQRVKIEVYYYRTELLIKFPSPDWVIIITLGVWLPVSAALSVSFNSNLHCKLFISYEKSLPSVFQTTCKRTVTDVLYTSWDTCMIRVFWHRNCILQKAICVSSEYGNLHTLYFWYLKNVSWPPHHLWFFGASPS